MNCFYDTFPTPCGPFSIAVTIAGDIRGTAFGDVRSLRERLGSFALKREATAVRPAHDQVLAYFEGEQRSFDVPLAECGTEFQQRVWSALRAIPYGETRTYAEIARAIGNPAASRAVGRANATNPICLIVPCHRVIGTDGSLTGFAFGEDIKRRLLTHEGAATGRESRPAALQVVCATPSAWDGEGGASLFVLESEHPNKAGREARHHSNVRLTPSSSLDARRPRSA